jgi:hypothetical protein
MAIYGLFLLGLLVSLPALVAHWIGILGLRHGGRNGPWWSMATGVVLTTLGMMTSLGSNFFIHGSPGAWTSLVLYFQSAATAFGSLLFAIGFAVHGLRAARAASRLRELEQLAAAMSEEIHQLRQGGTTA